MSKNKLSHNSAALHFNLQFEPQTGKCVQVAPSIWRICAPNVGPYTFTGTNTYLVGNEELFVIDPGPNDAAHLDALVAAINGRAVKAILLTHTHKDHSALAQKLKTRTKAPLWFGGKHRLSRAKFKGEINLLQAACDWKLSPDRELTDGEAIEISGTSLEVITTPGHCANHLSFGVLGTEYIFCGDHVMGWNSTLVATPDGSMQDYFNSLERLSHMEYLHYFPGHGAPVSRTDSGTTGRKYVQALRAHRKIRNQQILNCVQNGATSVSNIVKTIYPGVPLKIRMAAAMTVQAHIEYLADQNRILVNRTITGQKFSPIAP